MALTTSPETQPVHLLPDITINYRLKEKFMKLNLCAVIAACLISNAPVFAQSSVPISLLPNGGTLQTDDQIPVTRGGTTVRALANVGTMAPQNANAVAITGGLIDGVQIGNTTPPSFPYLGAGVVTVNSSGLLSSVSPTNLYCLVGNGTAWNAAPCSAGSGTVTSVTFTGDGIIDSATPSTAVTVSGSVVATPLNQSAANFLAGPATGSPAHPTFRQIVGTDLPAPTTSSLGGIQAVNSVGHQWVFYIDTSGVPHLAQPAFTDISGTATVAQLPTATSSTLGIVKPDNSTITISGGVISAVGGGSGTVTTTGTPASGNLSKFSGSSSITNGDLSGDITTSGTLAATLATVNSNIGSFGSSTAIPNFTVNGKGLVTAAGSSAVIAPAGTLTGATLASGVTGSSLTSVGTLTGGATGAGFTVALGTSTITGVLPASNGGAGTVNGLLKANGSGVVSQAVANTDYQGALTLTTTGTSGAATLVGNTLNIPQYAGTTYTAGSGITLSGGAFSLNTGNANTWSALQTFGNNISFGGSQLNITSLISGNLLQYNGTNWVNVTPASIGAVTSLTTTGTSGAATFSGGVLNIPQYSGGGGSGTVNSGTSGQVAYYATTGTAVSGLNTTGSGNAVLATSPTFVTNLTTPKIIGGTALGSNVILASSSVTAGSSNTDEVAIRTSNGLAGINIGTVPTTSTAASTDPAQIDIDTYGRFLMTVNTPSTSNYNSTYNCTTPLKILSQPTNTNSAFSICGTYSTNNTTSNMAVFTVYDNSTTSASGKTALTATYVGSGTTSAGSGMAALGVAITASDIVQGIQVEADTYAASANAVGIVIATGGDATAGHGIHSYLDIISHAAGNSANNGIVWKASTINPLQTSGSLMSVEGTNLSATNGFDLHNATFSGKELYFPGFSVDGSGNEVANALTLSTITGSTQCLQVNSSGVVSGTGSTCGSGSGGVTSVAATGANGIGVSGSPITSSGTLAFSLGNITPTSVQSATVKGGTASGSTLSLTSSSVAANSSNTDGITIAASNSISASPSSAGPTTPLGSITHIDPYGRFLMTMGVPSTSLQDTTYNCNNPLKILDQPSGQDSGMNVCGTYSTAQNGLTENLATFTVYDGANASGSGGDTAVVGTAIATAGNAGVSGGGFLGIADATGGIATGIQIAASAYASGTDTIAAILLAGGDGVSGHNINNYLTFQSLAANNSAGNMIVIDDNTINPVLTSGTLFSNSGTNLSVTNGFDLHTATFSGKEMYFPGWSVDGSGNNTMHGLTLSTITGSTQCLQVNSSGVVSGTGSTCGGGGSGTVNSGTSGQIAYYASTGTAVSGLGTTGTGNVVLSSNPTISNAVTVSPTTGTNAGNFHVNNTGGNYYFGAESSTGGSIFSGSTAYSLVLGTTGGNGIQFYTNSVLVGGFSSGGGFTLPGSSSGTVSILTQATAGTYNFNLPTTAGTAGQRLTSQGGGSSAMTWTGGTTIVNAAGDTNNSSSGSGSFFSHANTYTIPANYLVAGKTLKITPIWSMTTGSAPPTMQWQIKAGSTVISTQTGTGTPGANLTGATGAFSFIIQGTAASGASVNVYTSPIATNNWQNGSLTPNNTAQPVALATNGTLTISLQSEWGSAGTGTNTMTLVSLMVEALN